MLDPPDVHYLWEISQDQIPRAEGICSAARYLACLGWGIDMAYAEGQLIGGDEIVSSPASVGFTRGGVSCAMTAPAARTDFRTRNGSRFAERSEARP